MKRSMILPVAICLLSAATAQDSDDNEQIDVGKVADKMYGRCMRQQTSACAQLKTFYVVNDFLGLQDPEVNGSSTGLGRSIGSSLRSQHESQINNMLLGSALDFISKNPLQIPISEWFSGPAATEQDESRQFEGRRRRILRRLALPLLIGVVMKGASIIPLVLGKLTLLGTMSLIASKLSILVSVLLGIKKLFGSSYSTQEYQVPAYQHYPDYYGAAPSAAGPYYRRVSPLYHQRSFGDAPIEQSEIPTETVNEEDGKEVVEEKSSLANATENEEKQTMTRGQRRLDEVAGKHVNIYNGRKTVDISSSASSL